MTRSLVSAVAATVAWLAMTAPPATAFDTGTHADITVEALRAEGFSQAAADTVRVENWFVDLYSSASVVPQSMLR